MVYPVKLADARVTLREFGADDVEAAIGIIGDDRVTQWLSFDSRDQVETAAMLSGVIERAQLQPRVEYYLGLSLGDASLIGFARLGLGGVRAAKLGYGTIWHLSLSPDVLGCNTRAGCVTMSSRTGLGEKVCSTRSLPMSGLHPDRSRGRSARRPSRRSHPAPRHPPQSSPPP